MAAGFVDAVRYMPDGAFPRS